jgi:uncharacterized OB-fold protein/nicotinamidase-related amidase
VSHLSPDRLPAPQPSDFSQPFWEATKRKVLLLQYDPQVQQYQFFARPVSIYTGRRNLEWRASSGRGTVYTYTLVHHAPVPAFARRTPYTVASITLAEGVRIMAHLINCRPQDVRIGMDVQLTWEPRGEYNIPVFEPLHVEQRMNVEQNLAQNAVVVFADLQDGIIDHAHTNEPKRIAKAAAALAKLAGIFSIPVEVTTIPMGPGTLAADLAAALPNAKPHVRTTTSSFDNPGFRKAIEDSKRRVLLVCGVATEIAVQRLTLAALRAGFDVQVVVDASGGFSERSEQAALSRMQAAGASLTSLPTIIGELAADFTQPQAGQALGILQEL